VGSDFDENLVTSMVRDALLTRKLEKADETTRGQYGLSYDELRKVGNTQMPPDLFREAMWAVRDCDIRAQFIVYGFTDFGLPLLVETDTSGKVFIREDFAVVGSGGYLAQSVMMHREHHESASVEETFYTVYEAKRYAEGDRSVGPSTTLLRADQDGGRFMITAGGKKWADKLYQRFGPRPTKKANFTAPEGVWSELLSTKNPPKPES
jgi:hypothetical protein